MVLRAGRGRVPGGGDGAGGGVEARGRAVPGGAAAGRAGRPETEGLSWLGSRRAHRRHRWCSGSGCGTRSGTGCGSPRTGTSRAPSSGRCGAARCRWRTRRASARTPRCRTSAPRRPGWPARRSTWRSGWPRWSTCGGCATLLDAVAAARAGRAGVRGGPAGRRRAGRPGRCERLAGGAAGRAVAAAEAAVAAFLDRAEVQVERLTKDGRRLLDARARWSAATVGAPPDGSGEPCAILDLVVRQVTPAVRPDDVLAALRAVAGLAPAAPPRATRLAQGRLDDRGRLADPLAPDRSAVIPAMAAMDAPRFGRAGGAVGRHHPCGLIDIGRPAGPRRLARPARPT